jgi:hypothetical protein
MDLGTAPIPINGYPAGNLAGNERMGPGVETLYEERCRERNRALPSGETSYSALDPFAPHARVARRALGGP